MKTTYDICFNELNKGYFIERVEHLSWRGLQVGFSREPIRVGPHCLKAGIRSEIKYFPNLAATEAYIAFLEEAGIKKSRVFIKTIP